MKFRLAIGSRIPSYPTARLQADFKAAVLGIDDSCLGEEHPDGRVFAWADIYAPEGVEPFARSKEIVRAMAEIADLPPGSTLLLLESESGTDLILRLEMIESAEARYGIDLSTTGVE